jgi:hypothetical protein
MIAETGWTRGQVSYRRSDFEKPEPLSAGLALRDGARVRTEESASAAIRFPGTSTTVMVGPRAEASFAASSVTLLSGSLSLRRPNPGARAVPRDTPSIRTGAFTIQPDFEGETTVIGPQNGRFKLRVLAGSATLLSASGVIFVHHGEEATFHEKGGEPPRVGKLAFALVSPRDGESVSPEQARVRFRWNVDVNSSEGRALELVVANSPSFTSLQQTYVVPASEPPLAYVEIKTSVPPSRSPWYWKVRARGDSQFSYPERFWILPRSGPRLRFPLPDATAKAGSPVELIWDRVDNSSGYEVEAGGTTTRTSAPWISLPSLAEGTIRWRVRAILADGEATPWSPSREISATVAP